MDETFMSKSANSHPRILLITDIPFWRRGSGGPNRVESLYRFLAATYPATRALFLGSLAGHDAEQYRTIYGHPLWRGYGEVGQRLKTAQRLLQLLDQFGKPWRWILGRMDRSGRRRSHGLPRRDHQRHFRYALDQLQPDVVIVVRIRLTHLVRSLPQGIRSRISVLCDTIDIEHQRNENLAKLGVKWAQITREEEAALFKAYDGLIAIQEKEAVDIREMAPGVPVITLRHAEDIKELPPPDREPVVIGYIAKNNRQNAMAMIDFIQAGWSSFQKERTGKVELHIAGDVGEAVRSGLPETPAGVVFRGRVTDVEAFYRECDIIVNPIAGGSGLKIKNVEALCHGKPLVTTEAGAIGLEDGASQAFMVATNAAAMFEPLARLVDHPAARHELAGHSLAYARRAFAPEVVYDPLLKYIETIPAKS
jgi:glycosyltransferase involved in cell wall biosynthesis